MCRCRYCIGVWILRTFFVQVPKSSEEHYDASSFLNLDTSGRAVQQRAATTTQPAAAIEALSRANLHIAFDSTLRTAQVYLSLGWLDQAGFLLDSMHTPIPNALSGDREWLKGLFQAFENAETVRAFDHGAVAAKFQFTVEVAAGARQRPALGHTIL